MTYVRVYYSIYTVCEMNNMYLLIVCYTYIIQLGLTSVTVSSHLHHLQPNSINIVYGSACHSPTLNSIFYNRNLQFYCYHRTPPITATQFTTTERQYALFPLVDDDVIMPLWSVLKDLDWKNIVVFYDTKCEAIASEFAQKISSFSMTSVAHNIDRDRNVTKVLSLTAPYNDVLHDSRKFIVIASTSNILHVLRQADIFDDMNEKITAIRQMSRWLVLNPIESMVALNYDDIDLDNVAFIETPKRTQFTTDLSGLQKNLKSDLNWTFTKFAKPNENQPFNSDDLSRFLKDEFLSALNILTECWKARLFTLLWKPGGRSIGSVGQVTNTYDVIHTADLFPNTKYGFNNRTFTVAFNTWFPYIVKREVNGVAVYSGFCMDLLQELASSMNFSYIIVMPEDGQWGVVENGSWTGLVGQIVRREADLTVAPLVISSERLKVMDFSFPFFHDYSTVLYKRQDPNLYKWRKLVDPLKWEVFMCILISFMVVTITLYLMEKHNPFYKKLRVHSFQEYVIYVFGAMLTQGGPNQPRSSSGRILIACWWLFSIVVVAIYSGNLIAFLTVTKDQPPFETLSDLSQQDTYKWGTIGGTIWTSFLKTANTLDTKALWAGVDKFNKTDPDVLSIDVDTHLEKVANENYAFLADKAMLEIKMATECDWVFLKELFYPLQYAVGLPMKSPYNKLFYDEMLRIYETGLLQIWRKRWWPKKGTCKGSLITEAKRIELVDLQSAFYVIAIGIVGAAIIIISECFYFKRSYSIQYQTGRDITK